MTTLVNNLKYSGNEVPQHTIPDNISREDNIEFFTEKEVAERYKISVAALRAWRFRGLPPTYHKFGAAVRYSLSDLQAYEKANDCKSTAQFKA